ncbi:DUF6414 family protein [Arthrobacter pigmenti]
MLVNTHYLDRTALTNYIAALEGGLRESGTSKSTGSHGFGGSLGFGGMGVQGSKNSGAENTLNVQDHEASRLQRLIDAGHESPEAVGWIEVNRSDTEFGEAGTGAFIEWECDVYVPEGIAAMANPEGLSNALHTMQALRPSAESLGLDMEGVPDSAQMESMASSLNQLDISPVVVGDDSDTDWRVVGSLNKQWISPDASFDGRVRIVGKVKKRVGQDRWYPMMSLPGMNLVDRDERRRMEREGPRDDDEQDQFVRGPLLVLDYLAIFS